jgi:hypothetical protein
VASKREPSEDEEEQKNSAQNLTNKISLSLSRSQSSHENGFKTESKKMPGSFFLAAKRHITETFVPRLFLRFRISCDRSRLVYQVSALVVYSYYRHRVCSCVSCFVVAFYCSVRLEHQFEE